MRRFDGHADKATFVTFSPDGKTLLSTSDDKTVRLWDIESGNELKSLQVHQSMTLCALFTPSGEHFLSVSGWPPNSHDHTLRYCAIDGTELWKGEHHQDTIWKVSISADGKRALTASRDATVRLWKLPDELIALDHKPALDE